MDNDTQEFFNDAEIEKEKKGIRFKNIRSILAVVIIICLSIGAGFGGGMLALYYGEELLPHKNIVISTQDSVDTAEAIAAKVIPSVVGISTSQVVRYQGWFGSREGVSQGSGTGIIVDEQGYILTNSHVVNDGDTEKITVQLYDGREVIGQVLWSDRNIDLAIVKINAGSLKAAELGDSDTIKIGSYAAAIGNPLGMAFERSVTQGIISGLDRTILVSDGESQSSMEGLLQTDASINSGNSGGPLLNKEGLVIGINSAKAQSAEGLGFAIPINSAKPIIDEIKSKGEFKRAYIGIRGINLEDYLSAYPNEDFGTKKGIYVVQIYTDSPASDAGIKEGDIITSIDDKSIFNMTQLITTLYSYRPNDKILITILRNNKELKLYVVLDELIE